MNIFAFFHHIVLSLSNLDWWNTTDPLRSAKNLNDISNVGRANFDPFFFAEILGAPSKLVADGRKAPTAGHNTEGVEYDLVVDISVRSPPVCICSNDH